MADAPVETGNPQPTAEAGDMTRATEQNFDMGARRQFALFSATPAQITADKNDYDPQDVSVLRLSSDAARSVTGISSGSNGRLLTVVNAGSYAITLKHQSASSAASNRVICPEASDLKLKSNQSATLWYDAVTCRWRVTWTSASLSHPTSMVVPGKNPAAYATFWGLAFDSSDGYVYTNISSTVGKSIELDRWLMNGPALLSKGYGTNYYFYYDSDTYALGGTRDVCVLGDYIYGHPDRKSPHAYVPVRWAKADASVEELTVSGTAPDDGSNVKTDGTFLYFHQPYSTAVKKYSISGTTITYVSTITLADKAMVVATDGTNIWYVTSESGGASAADYQLFKADMTGATVTNRGLIEAVSYGCQGLDIDAGRLWGLFYCNIGSTAAYWIIPIEEI